METSDLSDYLNTVKINFDALTPTELRTLWEAAIGLGPSVCTKCMVHGSYRPHPTNPKKQGTWYCPICGSEDIGHLLEVPEARWSEIDDNTKFLKFVMGDKLVE